MLHGAVTDPGLSSWIRDWGLDFGLGMHTCGNDAWPESSWAYYTTILLNYYTTILLYYYTTRVGGFVGALLVGFRRAYVW